MTHPVDHFESNSDLNLNILDLNLTKNSTFWVPVKIIWLIEDVNPDLGSIKTGITCLKQVVLMVLFRLGTVYQFGLDTCWVYLGTFGYIWVQIHRMKLDAKGRDVDHRYGPKIIAGTHLKEKNTLLGAKCLIHLQRMPMLDHDHVL